MATLTLVQAITDALRTEMRRDGRVVVLGEDTPFPYTLESEYLPLAPRILAGVDEAFRFVA